MVSSPRSPDVPTDTILSASIVMTAFGVTWPDPSTSLPALTILVTADGGVNDTPNMPIQALIKQNITAARGISPPISHPLQRYRLSQPSRQIQGTSLIQLIGDLARKRLGRQHPRQRTEA